MPVDVPMHPVDELHPYTRGDGGAPSALKKIVFTINAMDADPEVLDKALADLEATVNHGMWERLMVSREFGGTEQREHFQGYGILADRRRMVYVGNRVRGMNFIEPQMARKDRDAWDYAEGYEDGVRKDGWVEVVITHGDPPSVGSGQGRRSDLLLCDAAIADGTLTRFDEVNDDQRFTHLAAQNRHWVSYRLERARREALNQVPRYPTPYDERVWQHQMSILCCETVPDDRSVYVVVDRAGGAGKSRFCYELTRTLPAPGIVQLLRVGRKADMAEAVNPAATVVAIDIPRSKQEHVDHLWAFVEELKDGTVFRSKYESEVKQCVPCHVIIFQNHEVDVGGTRRDNRGFAADARLSRNDHGDGGTQSRMDDFRYHEPPLTFDRYRILEINERLVTPMSEGGDEVRACRFKTFDDASMHVVGSYGPLEPFVDARGVWLANYGAGYIPGSIGGGGD